MLRRLAALGLASGRAAVRSLPKACHGGRLKGGLSVSLRATPDELLGPLTLALGGAARQLKVVDVRTGTPMVMEMEWRSVREKWELVDLEALVHNLNDLLAPELDVAAAVVLGEWEDMLELWCAQDCPGRTPRRWAPGGRPQPPDATAAGGGRRRTLDGSRLRPGPVTHSGGP